MFNGDTMKIIMCFFIFLSSIFVNKNVNSVSNQYVNKSYIVLNALNNEMLEGKDVHLQRSVASVSKIMTAVVAIESGLLDKEVTIVKEDLDTYGSSVYLKEGNKISLRDLVYGLMLRSGNDAALAIARFVGGNVEKFVEMMNVKASKIGLINSVFNNPSGLDVGEVGNLSTSYDLALLMSYAIKNETFLNISSTKEYKSDIGLWTNKNKLLRTYNKIIAGKTGFTYKAKRTLVTAAKDDESVFVVVTLDCGNDFNYHRYLYERSFQQYKSFKLLSVGENYIDEYLLLCKNDIYVTLKNQNLEKYSVIHEIAEDKSSVYLAYEGNSKLVGECGVEKISTSKRKQSIFEKIIDWFRKK